MDGARGRPAAVRPVDIESEITTSRTNTRGAARRLRPPPLPAWSRRAGRAGTDGRIAMTPSLAPGSPHRSGHRTYQEALPRGFYERGGITEWRVAGASTNLVIRGTA